MEERRRALTEEIRRNERALGRYYHAFEHGDLDSGRFQARVSGLETRLDALREQDADLAQQLAVEVARAPDNADLEAVAARLERTIADEDPKQAKALLRLLIKEVRVNGRSEILPTYRVITPEVCALPSSVGPPGIEPGKDRSPCAESACTAIRDAPQSALPPGEGSDNRTPGRIAASRTETTRK